MHLVPDPQRMRDEGPRPKQVWFLSSGHVVVIKSLGDGVARCLAVHEHPRLAGPGDIVDDGLVACPDLDYPIPLAWFKDMTPIQNFGRSENGGGCRHWRLVHKLVRERFATVLEDYFEWFDATHD